MRTFWIVALCFAAACLPDSLDSLDGDGAGADDSLELSTQMSAATVGAPAIVANTGGVGLRMRTGPGTSYDVIRVIPEGAVVDVVGGPSGSWYRIAYAGRTGWAHGAYLQTVRGKNNLLPWTANDSYWVTQGHNGGSHTGLGRWAWDFGTPSGTPIRAAHFGTVRLVKGNSTRGGCSSTYANDANYVIVDQGNGYESLYLHLRSVSVGAGQRVSRGDLVGHSGQTGWACGAHLHFQVQLSPSNGGGSGFYNPSIHDYFYDPGYAWDPAPGTRVTSKNGVSNQPRSEPEQPHGDVGDIGDLGDLGEAWDRAMAEASSNSLAQ